MRVGASARPGASCGAGSRCGGGPDAPGTNPRQRCCARCAVGYLWSGQAGCLWSGSGASVRVRRREGPACAAPSHARRQCCRGMGRAAVTAAVHARASTGRIPHQTLPEAPDPARGPPHQTLPEALCRVQRSATQRQDAQASTRPLGPRRCGQRPGIDRDSRRSDHAATRCALYQMAPAAHAARVPERTAPGWARAPNVTFPTVTKAIRQRYRRRCEM